MNPYDSARSVAYGAFDDIDAPLLRKAKRQDERRAFIDNNRRTKATQRQAKRNRKGDAKRHRNRRK